MPLFFGKFIATRSLRNILNAAFALIFTVPLLIFFFNALYFDLISQPIIQLSFAGFLFSSLLGFILLRRIVDRIIQLSVEAVNISDTTNINLREQNELKNIVNSFHILTDRLEVSTLNLNKRVSELKALKEITDISSSVTDFRQLFDIVLEKLLITTDSESGMILSITSDGKKMNIETVRGVDKSLLTVRDVDVKSTVSFQALEGKKFFISEDPSHEQGFNPSIDGIFNGPFLAKAITARGKEIGVLNLSRKKNGKQFGDQELNYISTVLGQIDFAFNNAQLILELKEYSQTLESKVEERTTELRKALYDTEEARDRIDGILKSINEGLIVTDISNRIVLMNTAAEDLLGVCFSDVVNRSIEFAITDKKLLDHLKTTFSNDIREKFDFEFMKNGIKEPRFMEARTSVIWEKNHKKSGIITVFYDVTHERELEYMKAGFISTVAHELRTPLTSLLGFSEILLTQEDLDNQTQKKYLSYINKHSVKLSNIINEMLDISRFESEHGINLNKELHVMSDSICNVVSFFKNQSEQYKIEVVIQDKSLKIHMDKEKIEQVLKRILSNAMKFSPKGGLIKVTGEVVKDYYEVSVQDHGIGMSSDQVKKICDKFYRADVSDTALEGTGLGMSIVKYIIEEHGGKLEVTSELGKGTLVKFAIPMKPAL